MNSILILANSDMGLYKFRKELLKNLARDYQVTVICPLGDFVPKLQELGVELINIKLSRRSINPFKDFFLFVSCFTHIRNQQPDLLITYTIKPNIYGGVIASMHHIPYIANITGLGSAFEQNNWLKILIITLYKIALSKASLTFFENEKNKNTFIKYKIIQPFKAFVQKGAGVNLNEYSFCDYPQSQKIRFLFIGRIMKEKGIRELLCAAKEVKMHNDDVDFDIIGPLEDDYLTIINVYKENNIINYLGYQNDVRPFIEQCHCLILPSYHEGMANTLLEAGAMGRPLITSDIHGCMEAVIDGKNGYLCVPKSSQSLINAIHKFLNLSHEEKKKMGNYSNFHIRTNFDKKQVIRITQEKIGEIINER